MRGETGARNEIWTSHRPTFMHRPASHTAPALPHLVTTWQSERLAPLLVKEIYLAQDVETERRRDRIRDGQGKSITSFKLQFLINVWVCVQHRVRRHKDLRVWPTLGACLPASSWNCPRTAVSYAWSGSRSGSGMATCRSDAVIRETPRSHAVSHTRHDHTPSHPRPLT